MEIIPLTQNTAGRISDVCVSLSYQLIDAHESSRFGLHVEKFLSNSCTIYISASETKEDLLFCKPIVRRASFSENMKQRTAVPYVLTEPSQ